MAHLLAVAAVVIEYGGDEDETIAALLHDAVEDQGGLATREEIRRRFGEKVVRDCRWLHRRGRTPKPPWWQRKEAFIGRLRQASASVRLVVAADKLHNARSILHELSPAGRIAVGSFPRRPRGHASLLPRRGRCAETDRADSAGGGT